MMSDYRDPAIVAVEVFPQYIEMVYRGGMKYRYSYQIPGKESVEIMKEIIASGQGLSAYIAKHVKNQYEKRWLSIYHTEYKKTSIHLKMRDNLVLVICQDKKTLASLYQAFWRDRDYRSEVRMVTDYDLGKETEFLEELQTTSGRIYVFDGTDISNSQKIRSYILLDGKNQYLILGTDRTQFEVDDAYVATYQVENNVGTLLYK